MKHSENPLSEPNIRLFLWFRIFFNARFYYPIFTILFLDYGMSLGQFAILNVAWAITIIFLEIPSGALADIVGRKRLVVIASMTMIIEMIVVCFIPLGNITLVFYALLANRVLSGLAEAMASGADEALAYDSLAASQKEHLWSDTLAILMRRSAIAMMLAMLTGAALYDADFLNNCLQILSFDYTLDSSTTMRIPLFLTLFTACLSLIVALKMKEVERAHEDSEQAISIHPIRAASSLTLQVGKWIIRTPLVCLTIFIAMNFDGVTRMFVTLGSEYYRYIGFPEASFGLISTGIAITGIAISKYAGKLIEAFSMSQNLIGLGIFLFICLTGVSFLESKIGLLFAMGTFASFYLLNFMISHYLNKQVPSKQRATVLSFRSMGCNLAYGLIGIIYAIASQTDDQQVEIGKRFHETLILFPSILIISSFLVICYAWINRRKISVFELPS